MNALVTDIQRFCMHDGPGIRTTVFLKGCPLRCRWCHNPETQSALPQLLFTQKLCVLCHACEAVCPAGVHRFSGAIHTLDRTGCLACGKCVRTCPSAALELSGREMTPEEILRAAEADRAFYGTRGGLTLSGGEPLAQPEATAEILRLARAAGLHTLLETCGFCPPETLRTVAPLTDAFYFDCKDTDPARHLTNTGAALAPILSNLRLLDSLLTDQQVIRLRCILVNGVNTEDVHYRALAALSCSLQHCEGVEFLPYHALGGSKMVRLGGTDNGVKAWVPSEETVSEAERILAENGGHVCHGRR